MPYYRELDFLDEPESVSPSGVTGLGSVGNMRFGTSFRNSPRSQFSRPVADYLVDPYAWFLATTAQQRVEANGQVYKPDRGHAWHSETHTASKLSTAFRAYGTTRPCVAYASPGYWTKTKAPFFNYATDAFPALPADDLAAFGQQAIAKTAPAPSVMSGAQFLGELREGLPKLVGAALIKGRVRDVLNNAGSEYLNVQFGWLPLVNDVKNLAATLLQLDKILASKRALQGKPRKASFALPPVDDFQEVRADKERILLTNHRLGTVAAPFSTWIESRALGTWAEPAYGSDLYYLRTVRRWRRFEGLFTSYFDYPAVDASWIDKANALISMELNPTVLWELAPWSWLVDWVFHIQTCITSNSVGNDKRVVMNYGYVTEKYVYRSLFTGKMDGLYGWPSTRRTFGVQSEDVYLRRIRANPFGFQVTHPNSLTASQIGVLSALGASWRK